MLRLGCLSILLSVTISCEKEIPLTVEQKQPLIVLNGIFEAGKTIEISITESRPVTYEGNLPPVLNATAKLFDSDKQFLGEFAHDSADIYHLDYFVPLPGDQYFITVDVAGLPSALASVHIPENNMEVLVDKAFKENEVIYEIQLTDNPHEQNFYAVSLTQYAYNENMIYPGYYIISTDRFSCTRAIEIQNGNRSIDGDLCNKLFLFSDESFNGSDYTLTLTQNLLPNADSTVIVIEVKSISEDYFLYELSRSKTTPGNSSPFQQPVLIYTNVNNGLGIIGGGYSVCDTLIF